MMTMMMMMMNYVKKLAEAMQMLTLTERHLLQ
jgi:hypothetical protein